VRDGDSDHEMKRIKKQFSKMGMNIGYEMKMSRKNTDSIEKLIEYR
jgi:hypothetical protein